MDFEFIRNRILGKKGEFRKLCKANNLTIDFKSNMTEFIVLKSIFEDREYADYFPFYKKIIVVDIGAHYGYFSLFAHNNSDLESKIYSIEPEKKNYSYLNQNILDCHASNIKTYNIGIVDISGTAKLFKGENVNHSLIENNALLCETKEYETVDVKSLKDFISENQINQIDFLKMDCEGAEYRILENLPKEIYDKITTISLEFHDMKDAGINAEAILHALIRNGFKIVKFTYNTTKRNLNFGKIIGSKTLL